MRKSIKIGKWKLGIFAVKHRRARSRGKTNPAPTEAELAADRERRKRRTPNSELPSVREMRGILKDDDDASGKKAEPRNDWQNQVI